MFLDVTQLSFNSIESWSWRYGAQTYPPVVFGLSVMNLKIAKVIKFVQKC